MSSWQKKKLGDVCNIELGKTPYRKDKTLWDVKKETKNVWLSIADLLNTDGSIVNDSKEYISDKAAEDCKTVKRGTLLVSFKLTLGRLAFAGRDLFTNEAIAALTIKNESEIDNKFLYKYLSFYDWEKAAEGDVKVKGKTLNKSKLKEIEVIFPNSLVVQERIVSHLDRAFAAINQAKANAEKNLHNAKELFESYLHNVLQNDQWEEKELGKVCLKTDNIKWNNSNGKSYHYIDLTAVCRDELKILETAHVNEENAPSRAKKIVKQGDIIFATTRPTLKRLTVIPEKYNNQICSTGFTVLRPNPGKVISSFIFYSLLQESFMNRMEYLQRGASYPAVTDSDVKGFLIPVPTIKEQKQIVHKLDTLRAEIQKLETLYQKKIAALDELKKSILQKAFQGELETKTFETV